MLVRVEHAFHCIRMCKFVYFMLCSFLNEIVLQILFHKYAILLSYLLSKAVICLSLEKNLCLISHKGSDVFQEVQKRLEEAKAGIDKLDREKEEVYQQCELSERQRVRAMLQDLHTSWQEINEQYTDRHRYGIVHTNVYDNFYTKNTSGPVCPKMNCTL